MKNLKISLGAILFFWNKQEVLNFYADIVENPNLSTIYLGEIVCSRRQQLKALDWLNLAKDITKNTQKEVILSSQTLLESESDLKNLRRLISESQGQFKFEANDLGAVKLLSEQKIPFVAGTTLNIYNAQTLQKFADFGAIRWVPPLESSKNLIADVIKNIKKTKNIQTEIFAFGKLPLAYSARCFTARHYDLSKDDCQFRCLEHPHGLTLKTRENQDFLCLNGIQTMSAQTYNLLPYVAEIQEIGADFVRISPQKNDNNAMNKIIDAFAAAINKTENANLNLENTKFVNGYWLDKAGIE